MNHNTPKVNWESINTSKSALYYFYYPGSRKNNTITKRW